MKKTTALLAIFASLTMTSLFAEASLSEFESLVIKAQQSCPSLNCDTANVHLVTLTEEQTSQLPLNTLEKLNKVAWSLAQIWGDTILEGDYIAAHSVHLDRVEKVVKGDTQIGFRLTYSSKAWAVGDCDYDYENAETLVGCDEGRITESGFVSMDLKKWFRDDHAMAEFQ